MVLACQTSTRRRLRFSLGQVLTSLVAVSALCDFLYYLPVIGGVLNGALLTAHFAPMIVLGVLAYRVLLGDSVKIRTVLLVGWIGGVFLWLYGFSFAKFLIFGALVAVLFLNPAQQRSSFEKFITIFCLILAVNELAYPFISLGMMPSFGEMTPDNWLKQESGMYYENFGLSFVLHGNLNSIQLDHLMLYRMSAWFEEPGNIGTVAALLLAATDFKMDWRGKVLLIGGVMSFSLAFFAIVIAYTLIKKPKLSFYLLGLLLSLTWYFQDNEFVSSKLIDRVSISDQGVSGDNRTEVAFDNAFKQYARSDTVWLGHDAAHQLSKLHYNASSWKNLVWDHGIVGTMFYISTFVLVLASSVRQNGRILWKKFMMLLPFVLVFLLSIYQRPQVLVLSFFLIFVGAMTMADESIKNE